MKWLLAKKGNQVNVYPEKDILPHEVNLNCPCHKTIIHMMGGDSIKLAMAPEVFIAVGEIEMVLHYCYTDGITDN